MIIKIKYLKIRVLFLVQERERDQHNLRFRVRKLFYRYT
jgi:hypothetical protein